MSAVVEGPSGRIALTAPTFLAEKKEKKNDKIESYTKIGPISTL